MKKTSIDNSRIGIALGSGSARGWAHIGVLQALSAMGIRPEIVAGSSIGALVGAAYACDRLDDMEVMVEKLNWKDIAGYLDMSIIGGGLVEGDKLVKFFREQVTETDIVSLPRRYAAVATDWNTGREVWLQDGDLLDAVRASVALPGLFTPFQYNNQWLVDGGIVNPVPVSLCRAMGADIVIAVSLNANIIGKHTRNKADADKQEKNSKENNNETALFDRVSDELERAFFKRKNSILSRLFGENINTPGLIDVIAGSINIMQDRITRSRMAGDPPDIILSPRLSDLDLLEFDQGAMAIKEGRACVERMRPALENALSLV